MGSTPVQTTYKYPHDAAYPGMVSGNDYDADTGIVETAAGIGFGLAVSQGANDLGIIIGGTVAGFRGVTIRDVTLDPSKSDTFAQYDNAGVLQEGKIWVTPKEAVAAQDPVYFDPATGEFYKGVATLATAVGPLLGARWVDSAAANGLARIDMPDYNQA